MDWKERPELFLIGDFDLLDEYDHKIERWTIYKGKILWWCYSCGSQGEWVGKDIDGCTLIACRIEDMTDEELSECENLWHHIVYAPDTYLRSAKEALQELCKNGDFDTIMHLLSIGVYPFEWNESVIDKKTLTQTV